MAYGWSSILRQKVQWGHVDTCRILSLLAGSITQTKHELWMAIRLPYSAVLAYMNIFGRAPQFSRPRLHEQVLIPLLSLALLFATWPHRRRDTRNRLPSSCSSW